MSWVAKQLDEASRFGHAAPLGGEGKDGRFRSRVAGEVASPPLCICGKKQNAECAFTGAEDCSVLLLIQVGSEQSQSNLECEGMRLMRGSSTVCECGPFHGQRWDPCELEVEGEVI